MAKSIAAPCMLAAAVQGGAPQLLHAALGTSAAGRSRPVRHACLLKTALHAVASALLFAGQRDPAPQADAQPLPCSPFALLTCVACPPLPAPLPGQANEILHHKLTLNGYLAEFTGQSMETITADTDRDFFMSAQEAVSYLSTQLANVLPL